MFDIAISKKMLDRRGGQFTLNTQIRTENKSVVLFGPSGSGKSLTLQAIAGLIVPEHGHIRIGETTLFDTAAKINVPPRLRRIGVIFQDYALFPHLSVCENVGFGLKKMWRPLSGSARERVAYLLDVFGLVRVQHALPSEISGGQQQRCALARALAVSPELLLLDEPFSALDIPLRKRMRQELAAVLKTFGIPMVLVTHDPAELEYFGETVVQYDRGGGRVAAVLCPACDHWEVSA